MACESAAFELPPRTALLRTAAGMGPHNLFQGGMRVKKRFANTLDSLGQMPPSQYRDLALAQAEALALVPIDGRVQILRALVQHLGIVPRRVIEFFSGPDLSGPLTFPESEYIQVSDDPPVAAWNSLPEEFFMDAGLEELANLKPIQLMSLPKRVQATLLVLLKQVLPNLVRVQDDVMHFSKRPEVQGSASLCLTLFWGETPTTAMERVVEDGGYLVAVGQPLIERRIEKIMGQSFSSRQGPRLRTSVYAKDLSHAFNDRLARLPGYEEMGITVRIYQKRIAPNGIYWLGRRGEELLI